MKQLQNCFKYKYGVHTKIRSVTSQGFPYQVNSSKFHSKIMRALLLTIVVVAFVATSVSGQWRGARLTHYTSYPECCDDPDAPDQSECRDYNGCRWKGQFAFVDGQKSLEWVKSHNIIAVHSKDSNLALKTLELRKNGRTIQGVVYDMCADSDCSGCCTRNAGPENFLIDLEKYTYERFGQNDGVIEWRCVNC